MHENKRIASSDILYIELKLNFSLQWNKASSITADIPRKNIVYNEWRLCADWCCNLQINRAPTFIGRI